MRLSDKSFMHGYHRYYAPALAPLRARRAPRVLEIGVFEGDSLVAWEAMFDK